MTVKVLLICNAGMSTSLLMNKVREYAASIDYPLEIEAHPVVEVGEKGKAFDVILLGPQIRFKLKAVQTAFPDKPVEVVDIQAYGTMNGEKVVKRIRELVGN